MLEAIAADFTSGLPVKAPSFPEITAGSQVATFLPHASYSCRVTKLLCSGVIPTWTVCTGRPNPSKYCILSINLVGSVSSVIVLVLI